MDISILGPGNHFQFHTTNGCYLFGLGSNPIVVMCSIKKRQKRRRKVVSEYGHPWPWRIPELVEEYAVDLRELADRWGVNANLLGDWVRRHGFRTENYQAVR